MINFQKHILANGLRVLVHIDKSAPIAAFNMLYNVGSKDESPDRTGLAHLFEHLMFGGSENVISFDGPLEEAGGQSNAFTSSDITNYFITIPKQNLETAFWLESDRLNSLTLNQNSINVQKAVVIEEFKQRYLNQPYGDAWLLLRPLAYKVHPYSWPTIGKDISHIENAGDDEIREFFNKHYAPANAILAVSGNVDPDEIFRFAEKWFGPIQRNFSYKRLLPSEPVQIKERSMTVIRDVPYDSIYLSFHCPGRKHPDFYSTDLISDILCGSESSHLYRELVKKKQLFSELDAFNTGDVENGLFILAGKVKNNINIEEAANGLRGGISEFITKNLELNELDKVKHKAETAIAYSELKALDKAMNLAIFENLGNANLVNEELANYESVTLNDISRVSNSILEFNNASFLYYKKDTL